MNVASPSFRSSGKVSLDHAGLRENLARLLRASESLLGRARLRVAAVDDADGWRSAWALLEFVQRGSKEDYTPGVELAGVVRLVEEWVGVDDALRFIDNIAQGLAAVAGVPIHFQPDDDRGHIYERLPSTSQTPSPWHLFTIRKRAFWPNADPIPPIYDGPFFESRADAITSWVSRQVGVFEHGYGSLLVRVPEVRARFAKLSHDAGALSLEIAAPALAPTLRLKGAIFHGSQRTPVDLVDLSSGGVSVPVPDEAHAVNLVLIGPDGTVYDEHREDPFSATARGRVLRRGREVPSAESAVRDAVARGEGDQIEFKPFIEPGSDKFVEVAETVCAFGNTKGGAVFVGISDRCSLDGVDADIARRSTKGGKSFETGMHEYIGELKKLLSDKLANSPPYEIAEVSVGGRSIVMIRVEASAPPACYLANNNDVFVRRGANNVRPNPEHDLPRLVCVDGGSPGAAGGHDDFSDIDPGLGSLGR